MTDRRPDAPDDPLPARLSSWFDQEVRQAGADLRAAPLAASRARQSRSRAPFAPVAAVILVVIVVIAGLTRLPGVTPGTEPIGSTGATSASGSGAPSPLTSPGTTGVPATEVASRYPDGIPSSLAGRYVARPSNIDREPVTDQPFLLGGWSFDFSAIAYSCPAQIGTPPPFGPRCGTPFLADQPLMNDAPRVLLDGWTAAIPAGAVILQVHRDDARAALCADDQMCRQIAVIEKVVWTGDALMATAPRTATDTFMRLIEADANLPQATLTPVGMVVPVAPGGIPGFTPNFHPGTRPAPLATVDTRTGYFGAQCQPPYPAQAWTLNPAGIWSVLVFPTTAAREAVDQDFLASGFIGTSTGGGTCQTITDGLYLTTWVAVDNVMVAVHVNVGGPTAAQARLIDDVRGVLTSP